MNIRLQKYKANRIAGMNQYNAARAAGYSETYSRNARPEKFVKVCIKDALEQAGITPKYRAEELYKLTQANKTVSAIVTGKDAGAADTDFIEVPDNPTRLATHRHITDLLGDNLSSPEGAGKGISKVVVIVQENNGNQSQERRLPAQVSVITE